MRRGIIPLTNNSSLEIVIVDENTVAYCMHPIDKEEDWKEAMIEFEFVKGGYDAIFYAYGEKYSLSDVMAI